MGDVQRLEPHPIQPSQQQLWFQQLRAIYLSLRPESHAARSEAVLLDPTGGTQYAPLAHTPASGVFYIVFHLTVATLPAPQEGGTQAFDRCTVKFCRASIGLGTHAPTWTLYATKDARYCMAEIARRDSAIDHLRDCPNSR